MKLISKYYDMYIIHTCSVAYNIQMSSTATFSPLSKHITNTLTKDEKKNGGIFFTPPSCIQQIMALLRDDVSLSTHTFDTILEPSCGSGEFLSVLMRQYPNAWITGVEIHPVIYAEVSTHFNSLVGGGRVSIQHGDFLKYSLPSKNG